MSYRRIRRGRGRRWRCKGLTNNDVVHAKFTCGEGSRTYQSSSSSTTYHGNSFAFNPSDAAKYGWNQYSAMYDQFRVNKLVLKFWTVHNTFPIAGTATTDSYTSKPHFYTAIDRDDNLTITSLNQILKYGTSRRHMGTRFSRVFVPAICAHLVDNTGFVYNQLMFKKWVDCATATPDFGFIKTLTVMETGQAQLTLKYQWTVYVSFRGRRGAAE